MPCEYMHNITILFTKVALLIYTILPTFLVSAEVCDFESRILLRAKSSGQEKKHLNHHKKDLASLVLNYAHLC